jgi:hypothetical protein
MNFKSAFARTAILSVLIFADLGILNAQSDSIHKLPAGTRLQLKMDVELSSKVASANDTFTCSLAKPVAVRDIVVLPVGTVVTGRVRSATAAGPGRNGELDVVFESLRIPMLPASTLDAELVELIRPRSSSYVKALSIIGGGLAGAIVGAAARGGPGAAIGAGAGAAGGTAIALFRRGKDARIREDQQFEIVLKRDVTLPVLDY